MKKRFDNPFVTTGYAGPEYFCDRQKETEDLIRLLRNGNNIALISPRRYGKTDLLRHCFAQDAISDNFTDIYSTKSVAEMVGKLSSTILEALKPKGTPSWSMSVGDIDSPKATLDEIFLYLRQAEKPCLIAIDEFQQISKYADSAIEAELRTHIQYCPNARFVFSGSRQHLMGQMFTSPARPFYQSVTLYTLNVLPQEKYAEFCSSHFQKKGKHLDERVVPALYGRFEGITYYIQRVMNELFSMTAQGETCQLEYLDRAIQQIVRTSAPIYEDLFYQLPEKQSLVMRALGKAGKVENITSSKFIKTYGLVSANSVKSAIPALVEKGLVTSERGEYQVYDKFFQIWMETV